MMTEKKRLTAEKLMDDLDASKAQIEAVQQLVTPEMKMKLPKQ